MRPVTIERIEPIARTRVPADDRALVAHAPTLDEAALWMLALMVLHGACEGGLVHRMVSDETRMVTRYAHGPDAARSLGATVSMHDAALAAATGDAPSFGLAEWARAMTRLRLRSAGLSATGVLALPLRARGSLVGLLEVSAPQGRLAFTPTNVGTLQDLASAFDARPTRV